MRIRIVRYVSGTTRGIALPRARNAELDVPNDLGAALCGDGIAVPVPDGSRVEHAVPPPDPAVETRSDPDPEDDDVTDDPDAATVRAWAVDQGFDVPVRGRLPRALYAAYEAAEQEQS